MSTAYQKVVAMTQLPAGDERWVRRHVETCPTCMRCEFDGRAADRLSTCRTLDAAVEMFVETNLPGDPSGDGLLRASHIVDGDA